MSDSQRKGSTAPMWWGVLIVMTFTGVAAINYNFFEGRARASVMAQGQGAAR